MDEFIKENLKQSQELLEDDEPRIDVFDFFKIYIMTTDMVQTFITKTMFYSLKDKSFYLHFKSGYQRVPNKTLLKHYLIRIKTPDGQSIDWQKIDQNYYVRKVSAVNPSEPVESVYPSVEIQEKIF